MDAGAGRLFVDDAGFLAEEIFPAGGDFGLGRKFAGELEEDFVVAEFGGEERFVEGGEFFVGGGLGEDGKAFAGAGFNEGGDAEAVECFAGFAATDECAEGGGVEAFVAALHAAAAADEETGDLGEVGGFVPGNAGHGFDPAGGPFIGPAGHEFHSVLGSFHFEERVVNEEGDGIGERCVSPFERGAGMQREGSGLFEEIYGHNFKVTRRCGD